MVGKVCVAVPLFGGTGSASSPDNIAKEPHVPGEPGLWVLIFGDLLLFGAFFTTYLVYRARDPRLFTDAQRTLNTNLGVTNTLILLLSSLQVVIGVAAVRQRRAQYPTVMFASAIVCGAAFGFNKYIEYSEKIVHGITPATNNFFMYYYILTGLHMFHVVLGMAVLSFMLIQARKPCVTSRQLGYIEGGACFWHMVDLLWIMLFALIYLVRS